MEQIHKKLWQWQSEEQELLNELAHEVACASKVEKMVTAKQAYDLQKTRVDTIFDAIAFVRKPIEVKNDGTP